MKQVEQLDCPICKGISHYRFSHKDFFGKDVRLFKCSACGHGTYDEDYSPEQFASIYKSEYAEDYVCNSESHEYRKDQYLQDLKFFSGLMQGDLKVLDLGCSSGEYLDAMPLTWIKFGYEVNPELIKHLVSNRPEYRIINSLSATDEKFDLITLRGVIEHIPDHHELLEFLNRNLLIGGKLFISATPDFSSPCAMLYAENWNQIVAPEHIHQFTPASLQVLLKRAGLVMKALAHPYMGTPYENWTQNKSAFMTNVALVDNPLLEKSENDAFRHPFPGNMMSVIFEKVV